MGRRRRRRLHPFTEGSLLSHDVDGAGIPANNPAHWKHFWRIEGDGMPPLSPVIFDADGSIVDSMFGAGARFDILGLSGLDTPLSTDPEIFEASILINGAFYDGLGLPASPEDLPSQEAFKAVMVHEIGHYLNLDHTVLNHELALDGDPDNDIYVPTMYPFAVTDEEAIASLNPDDTAALANTYRPIAPVVGIQGTVKSPADVYFQGAQVVLREQDDPLMTAYSRGLGRPVLSL